MSRQTRPQRRSSERWRCSASAASCTVAWTPRKLNWLPLNGAQAAVRGRNNTTIANSRGVGSIHGHDLCILSRGVQLKVVKNMSARPQ